MITDFDFLILNFINNSLKCDFMDFIMPKITFLGSGGFIWILIGVIMLFIKKYRKGGIVLLISLAAGAILGNLILKPIISRPRPCHINEMFPLLIDTPRDFSFPSGHTLASATAAYIITYFNKRVGYIVIPIAVLIAFSRLYLYVHFPSDVICGAAIGIFTAYFTIKIFTAKKFI